MTPLNKYRVTTLSDDGTRNVKLVDKEELVLLRAKKLQKLKKSNRG